MATKKSMWILLGILVISGWVLGSASPAPAETMKYKFYTWIIKQDMVPVSDVEGHKAGYASRGAFYVFENGEVATTDHVVLRDFYKDKGTFSQYVTIKFEDGASITIKSRGTMAGPESKWESEILKGTGRFQGIKGTHSAQAKYLPPDGALGYGEGIITYTLPGK
jgi:hypothetical protein